MSELSQLEQKLVDAEIKRVFEEIDRKFKSFIQETQIGNAKLFIGENKNELREIQAFQIWGSVLQPIWLKVREEPIAKSAINKAVADLENAQSRIEELEQQLGVYQDQLSEEQ